MCIIDRTEGQQVIVFGSVSVYERSGSYQLYAKEIRLDGEGVLYERYQQLKRELGAVSYTHLADLHHCN